MVDYYIKCVKKDSDGDIQRVGYGSYIDKHAPETKSKDAVISDIDTANKQVVTCYYSNSSGEWVKGDEVHTVDGDYIRTDGNDIKADNLDNLGPCPDEVL